MKRRRRRGPVVLGLTGSIGMGKSTVAAMFRRLRVPVFDADAAVRRAQAPGGRALGPIALLFPGVVGPGGLDRAALGARVFADAGSLARLEAVLHPLVAIDRGRFLARYARRRLVVLDVPLLFETGVERLVDAVAVVSAPVRVQRARVLARPAMTRAKFADIVARQMPDGEKRRRADCVIPTGLGMRATLIVVQRLARRLGGAAGERWRRMRR